jgi:hypothetical protein
MVWLRIGVLAGCVAILSGVAGTSTRAAVRQPGATPVAPAAQHALLDQYCVTCHSDRLRTGGLTLEAIDLVDLAGNAEIWEKVVSKLRAGAMPPQPRLRPDQPTYDGFRAWLETGLDRAAAANPNPGRTEALHRLSRTEYHNVIRDLLGLEIDVTDLLPADDTSYGFDNIAGVLGVSPTLMERYLAAARKISRLAIGSPVPSPIAETFRIASDLGQDTHIEGLPFGTRGGTLLDFNFPEDAEYVISVVPDGPLFLEAHQLEVSLDGERVELFSVGRALEPGERRGEYAAEADSREVRLRVNAGPHQVGVTFLKKTAAEQERSRKLYLRPFTGEGSGGDSRYQPYVERVTITGPFEASGARPAIDTPSRARLFTCQPANDDDGAATTCANDILSTLARRAYRRPVTDDDVERLLTFYEQGAVAGGFDGGIELALRRLLVSPEFLFRIEEDPDGATPGTPYALSDLELASRLSFFVWSSIPDDELLDVAIRGELTDTAVLEAQTRRMLADPRSEALVTNFAGQWLSLRNAAAVQPDEDQFPDFGEDLRQGFRRETELLFEHILRDNRSVVELLSADYTFINERLARHYGIANVRGSHFRRVSLDDPARAGLLGHGSILTVTSHANRTSPVVRGKWVLENILGNPPPPPPPNVPALEETTTGKQLTMREAMEQHRANPVCASCHRVMDPMGLALEPFDAIGRLRTPNQTKVAMDLTGVLPDGTTFEGPAGLRAALLAHPDRFVTTMTEKLVTYAVGRGMEYYDAPAVRAITRAAADDDYRLTTLILGVVKSPPFRMRSSQS